MSWLYGGYVWCRVVCVFFFTGPVDMLSLADGSLAQLLDDVRAPPPSPPPPLPSPLDPPLLTPPLPLLTPPLPLLRLVQRVKSLVQPGTYY